jgi:hypothetical protein
VIWCGKYIACVATAEKAGQAPVSLLLHVIYKRCKGIELVCSCSAFDLDADSRHSACGRSLSLSDDRFAYYCCLIVHYSDQVPLW